MFALLWLVHSFSAFGYIWLQSNLGQINVLGKFSIWYFFFLFFFEIFAAFWWISIACLWASFWLGKWEVHDLWTEGPRVSSNTVWQVYPCCTVYICIHFVCVYFLDYVNIRNSLCCLLLAVFPPICCWFASCLRRLKISVKVLSLSFQAGLVGEFSSSKCYYFLHIIFPLLSYISMAICFPEFHIQFYIYANAVVMLWLPFFFSLVEPFYGTICLYNRERREKMSEDFYFHELPSEMQNVSSRYVLPSALNIKHLLSSLLGLHKIL